MEKYKILKVQEPFFTLMKNGEKEIEFRKTTKDFKKNDIIKILNLENLKDSFFIEVRDVKIVDTELLKKTEFFYSESDIESNLEKFNMYLSEDEWQKLEWFLNKYYNSDDWGMLIFFKKIDL